MHKITIDNIWKNTNGSKKYLRKSNMTSGDEYLCTIKRSNGKSMTMHFHDNIENKSNYKDWIITMIKDKEFLASCRSFDDFILELGYDPYDRRDRDTCYQIVNQIKENTSNMKKVFTRTEMKVLLEESKGW